jgi:hypothetical protein
MLGQKNKEIPTGRIEEMKRQGLQNNEIISNLQGAGYKHEQIAGAMDQMAIKDKLSSIEAPTQEPVDEIPLALMGAPSPTQGEGQSPSSFAPEPIERASYDAIEEIAESIIKEKWTEMTQNIGDIKLWKERMDIDLEGTKQELIRTQEKFENLQKAVMGKISEYADGVTSIGTEMKALERVLEKILAPLTKSVKDLQQVTEKITTKKRATPKKKSTKKKK